MFRPSLHHCLTYVLSFKWVLQRRGPMWAIQSIGSPYCLGLDGEPEFHNPVVATCYHTDEYCWWIVADDPTYNPSIYRHVFIPRKERDALLLTVFIFRILANSETDMNTTYNVELTWRGSDPNSAQSRPVRLQRRYNRHGAQLWRFDVGECHIAPKW
jgi:hypothetical protein